MQPSFLSPLLGLLRARAGGGLRRKLKFRDHGKVGRATLCCPFIYLTIKLARGGAVTLFQRNLFTVQSPPSPEPGGQQTSRVARNLPRCSFGLGPAPHELVGESAPQDRFGRLSFYLPL